MGLHYVSNETKTDIKDFPLFTQGNNFHEYLLFRRKKTKWNNLRDFLFAILENYALSNGVVFFLKTSPYTEKEAKIKILELLPLNMNPHILKR